MLMCTSCSILRYFYYSQLAGGRGRNNFLVQHSKYRYVLLFWIDIILEYNKSVYCVLDENFTEIISMFIHDFTVVLDDVNACSSLMRCSKELKQSQAAFL